MDKRTGSVGESLSGPSVVARRKGVSDEEKIILKQLILLNKGVKMYSLPERGASEPVEIGRGAQGVIYTVSNGSGNKIVLKVSQSDSNAMFMEIKMLHSICDNLRGWDDYKRLFPLLYGFDVTLEFDAEGARKEIGASIPRRVNMYMEHIDGRALSSFDVHAEMESGHLIQSCICQLSYALAFIHRLGYVYRDMKPDNVMLCHGTRFVLIDYGTMASVESGSALTAGKTGYNCCRNEFAGSAAWMAPEVINVSQYPIIHSKRAANPTEANEVMARDLVVRISENHTELVKRAEIDALIREKGGAQSLLKELLKEIDTGDKSKIQASGNTYGYMVDWWSMGVLILYLLKAHSESPFAPWEGLDEGNPGADIFVQLMDRDTSKLLRNTDGFQGLDFIRSLLDLDPTQRQHAVLGEGENEAKLQWQKNEPNVNDFFGVDVCNKSFREVLQLFKDDYSSSLPWNYPQSPPEGVLREKEFEIKGFNKFEGWLKKWPMTEGPLKSWKWKWVVLKDDMCHLYHYSIFPKWRAPPSGTPQDGYPTPWVWDVDARSWIRLEQSKDSINLLHVTSVTRSPDNDNHILIQIDKGSQEPPSTLTLETDGGTHCHPSSEWISRLKIAAGSAKYQSQKHAGATASEGAAAAAAASKGTAAEGLEPDLAANSIAGISEGVQPMVGAGSGRKQYKGKKTKKKSKKKTKRGSKRRSKKKKGKGSKRRRASKKRTKKRLYLS